MKWVNRSLLVIWLCLLGLGVWWAWLDFTSATTIAGGGYLYNDNGEIIGMWDNWELANYPTWLFSIWVILHVFIGMPLWWMIAYWGIGVWLLLVYVLPLLGTGETTNAQ